MAFTNGSSLISTEIQKAGFTRFVTKTYKTNNGRVAAAVIVIRLQIAPPGKLRKRKSPKNIRRDIYGQHRRSCEEVNNTQVRYKH